ncbi:MAG: lamin tail domain-containing protein, partial [Melioribacteraceae bacterium]|nr:lamin tail domain-containing protein [Melioribacteraceae bacterium]
MKTKYLTKTFLKVTVCVIQISLFPPNHLAQNIILSEIMFAPSESNSEFIEIFNNSDEIVDLKGFKIKYHTTSPDGIISSSDNYLLNPKQYALIFEADYDFKQGVYFSLIPDSTLLFVLDDNAFGSGGMANTSNRKIFLISSLNDTIDSQTYSADNENGYSDERVSNVDSIWANSISFNGSPGSKNSVTPVQYDLEINRFFPDSVYSTADDGIILNLFLHNCGMAAAENFELNVYSDINHNKIGDPNELIYNQTYLTLDPHDSIFAKVEYTNAVIGENIFIAEIRFIDDENTSNNFYQLNVKGVSSNDLKGVVVINEIMYSPLSPEPEWLELYNNSDEKINLSGFKIADNSDTVDNSSEKIFIKPKQFLVIADDSSITNLYPNISNFVITNLPTLNNSGDKVIILDSLYRMIDSLEYFSDWGGKNGKSLERIEPSYISWERESWSESSLPTPGSINSITQKDYDLKIDTVFTNPRVPLIGENYFLSVQIHNIGKKDMQFNLQLFSDSDQDSLADKLLEETDLFSLSASSSININFIYTTLITQNSENYVIKLIAEDDDTTNNSYSIKIIPSYPKRSILINEIMYASGNYEPEWIELYNQSEYDINIENWLIGDVLTNPVFKSIEAPTLIGSNEYIVITKNNSIIDFHRNISSKVIELPFANLNNDEDGVVLKDRNNITIDSLKYFNEWSEQAGHSLERVSVNNSSVNINNWQSSLDIEGSTPGRINSRTRKDYDLVFQAIESIPKFPVEGENINFSMSIQNRGDKIAENFSIEISALSKDGVFAIEMFNDLFLDPGDSLTLLTNRNVNIEDTLTVLGEIYFSLDQDIINNYLETKIIPGFNRNTVLINEVMFKPNNNEPKWIELINNSDTTINIKNWLIGDLSSKKILTETDIWIEPGDFLVISDNTISESLSTDINLIKTELPNLSATKDAIIIYDYRNAVIDSMLYKVKSNFKCSVS